jgi:hypothetical protein
MSQEKLESYLRYLEQDPECNPAVLKHVQARLAALQNSPNPSRLKKNSISFGDLAGLAETHSSCNSGQTAWRD